MVNAGIYMGERLSEVVNEDLDFMASFLLRQRERMIRLIESATRHMQVWGFKAPNIQAVPEPRRYRDYSETRT